MLKICQAEPSDVGLLEEHMHRVVAENGQGKTPIFTLLDSESYVFNKKEALERWQKSSSSVDWRRDWFLKDGHKIVGHLKLDASGLAPSSHRMMIALGVEEGYRSLGFGEKLMEQGINWAKEKGFAWMDLGVFSHNEAAIALYKKLGFEIIGETKDGFRFRGENLCNLKMTLNLKC